MGERGDGERRGGSKNREMPRLVIAQRRAAGALTLRGRAALAALPRPAVGVAPRRTTCLAAPRWSHPPVGARGIVCGRPALSQQGDAAEGAEEDAAAPEPVAEDAGVAAATATTEQADEIVEPETTTTELEVMDASPSTAATEDVTSCRAWVQNFKKYDPGDYFGFVPGQEKVRLTIDMSPMKLSTLEVGVMRGIVGDRFDPALKQLRLTEESHKTMPENLEAAYAQARMLLGEVRRLAAEMAADPDLPRELLMKKLGGEAWCERTGKWIGESSGAPPSAPVPGVLTLHVGNLPRTMTGEELQKKLAGQVAGPVAVSKKRRDVWARVTVRGDEEQRAAVEQALADVESKHPVRVSQWSY